MAISQRYLNIANGHMILTGNTLLLSQATSAANAGPFITVNPALQVPGYPAGTTNNWQQNSAMAVLTIPANSTVLYAELTWTSLLVAGANNYSAFRNDPVTFITPATSTTVAPQFTDSTINIYTRSADVTALVQAGGSGQYTLGGVAGVNGFESTGITGNGAGWYLTVIVENPAEPSRLFQVNVGTVFVPGSNTIDFTIAGFSTPAIGPVTGRLFAGIQRGDPQLDLIPIFVGPNVANLNFQLTRPPLPNNNMIAGFISNTETNTLIDTSGTFGNNNNAPGNPPSANTLSRWHIDIASFNISPSLTNNQTTLVTRSISQAIDAVFAYNVFNIQIDAQSANITTSKTVDNAFVKVGDTLTYTITATNSGTIMADDVTITDTPPAGTTFVPGSVVVNGTPQPGADITAGVNIGSVAANGGTGTLTFQAVVNQIPTPNPLVNTATADYTFIPLPGEPPFSNTAVSNGATTQVNQATITVVKSATPAAVDLNGVITYTLVLNNTGNTAANNVVITDPVPNGTTFVAGSVTGATGTPPTLTVTNPIPAGGSATVTFQVQLNGTEPNPNPIPNSATTDFTFTVDPAIPNGATGTADSNTVNTTATFAQINSVKSVDTAFAAVGSVLTYTLTLTNVGNTAANNVVITDALPAGTTFVAGSLTGATGAPPTLTLANPIAAGGTATVTYQVQVGNTLPNPNPIPNSFSAAFTYTVDPAVPNGASGTTASNTTATLVNNASLTTIKAVDKAFAQPGDVLTYTITLENTGNTSANNVILTDAIPTGTTFIPGSLTGATGTPPTLTLNAPVAAGATSTVTFQVLVDNSIPSPNPLQNAASAAFTFTVDPTNPNGANGTSDSNTADTQINQAIVSITKTADPAITDINDIITYTLTLQNTGNVDANNVVLTDTIPAGTTFVAGSVTGATGTPPTLTLANPLPAGGSATVTFQVQVGNSIPNPNPVVNTASAAFTYTVDPAEPDGASGTVQSNSIATQVNNATILTSKIVDKAFATTGDVLTYTLTLQNIGNTPANNVVITDVIPTGTTFVPGSLTGAIGTPPTLTLASSIAAGGSTTIVYQVLVGSTLPNPNPVPNTADVAFTYTVDPANPNGAIGASTSNTVNSQINVANVSVVKTVDKNFVDAGDVLTYTLTFQNTGNVPANNVVITDPLPSGTTFVAGSLVGATGTPPTLTLLAPIPANTTTTVSYQIKVGNSVPNPNPISNTASTAYAFTVDPARPNSVAVTTSSNTVAAQVNTAKLNIVKRADKNIAYIGSVITYQIAVTNTGNVAADNVVVTDAIPNGTVFVPGSLTVSVPYTGTPASGIQLVSPVAPNQTVAIAFQVQVTAIPNPNPIENTVSAAYSYTVDPANPDGVSTTVTSNTVGTVVFRNNYGQQLTDLIESIALEEAAIANLANAEGAKIQAMIAMNNVTTEELLCLNKSVADMLDSITLLESVLKQKLNVVNCQINGTCM